VRETVERTAFWAGFAERIAERPEWNLGQFKHQHSNQGYIEFSERLGLGFRPRAVCLTNCNELRAEILTGKNSHGLALLDNLIAAGPYLQTTNGGIATASVSNLRSDGKVEIIWRDAMIGNRRLWSVHYDWIGESLLDLRATLSPIIDREMATP
jgi:hypothetical protein